MNSLVAQVGIDVAKHKLVVSIDQAKPFIIDNTVKDCQELAKRLPAACLVHLEASGAYERTVRRALEEGGLQVRVHNPLKVRRLVQARGRSAKTDPIDARMLSGSALMLHHHPAKSLERQRLADLSRAVQSLKQAIADFKRRLGSPDLDEDAKGLYEQAVVSLQAQAQESERKLARRIQDSSFASRHKLIMSIPCVGARTAAILLCELPEDLHEQNPAQICSYAGLAPIDDSSGMRSGRARLGRGNTRIKAALYMAALSAIRSQPWAKELYRRLRAKGKPHQSAIAPVMRRLLVRVVAVVKRDSPWQDEPPHP